MRCTAAGERTEWFVGNGGEYMYYKFTDDCLIGVEEIDEEHRGLFRLIGELHDMLEEDFGADKYDEICDTVEQLKRYTVEHFKHEEDYMEKIGHPELEQQRQQHAQFCEKINEMDIRSGESDQHALLTDMLTYLVKWLYRHIIGSDLLIGKLVTVDEWKQKENYIFTDKYITGIELIDEEHKELFRQIEAIQQIVEKDNTSGKFGKIAEALKSLRSYIQHHFEDEEDYMKRIGYEGLEVQQLAHDVFSTRLELMNLGEIGKAHEKDVEEFIEFLTEWLITHIVQMDKNIK